MVNGSTLIRVGSGVVRRDHVLAVDASRVDVDGTIKVTLSTGILPLSGPEAIDFMMRACPYALEGRRMRWARHAWAFHNLVAHPILQVLHWLGMTRLGMRIHDSTVPRPTGHR
jgi:hypothetical protein